MFARFQKYVYICTKNVTPRRSISAGECPERTCSAQI